MSTATITVTVKLFAAYQEACGVSEMQLEVEQGVAVMVVRDRLIAQYPQLAQWRDLTRFGVNLQFVEPDTLMNDGDEVVLIPPVSGGVVGGIKDESLKGISTTDSSKALG
jgi:molybdopterin synthase sulfur carrier subunit